MFSLHGKEILNASVKEEINKAYNIFLNFANVYQLLRCVPNALYCSVILSTTTHTATTQRSKLKLIVSPGTRTRDLRHHSQMRLPQSHQG